MSQPQPPCDCQNRADLRSLTVLQFCAELNISRSTFYEWRALQRAPRCIKLPNGSMRIQRADYEVWLDRLTEQALFESVPSTPEAQEE
jgi:predicted DNA-binding transcriptional regulator AlpA